MKFIRNIFLRKRNRNLFLSIIGQKKLNRILKEEGISEYSDVKKIIRFEPEYEIKWMNSSIRIDYFKRIVKYENWRRKEFKFFRVDWRISFKKNKHKDILIEYKTLNEQKWKQNDLSIPFSNKLKGVWNYINNDELEYWEKKKLKEISMTLYYSLKLVKDKTKFWFKKESSDEHIKNILNILINRRPRFANFYASNEKMDPELLWNLQIHDYRHAYIRNGYDTNVYLVKENVDQINKTINFNLEEYKLFSDVTRKDIVTHLEINE